MVEEKGSQEREACREKREGEGKPHKKDGEGVAHGDVQSESPATMPRGHTGKKPGKYSSLTWQYPENNALWAHNGKKTLKIQQFNLAMTLKPREQNTLGSQWRKKTENIAV